MVHETTDIRSNPNEQIKHVAETLKKSTHRRKVFEAIYKTKQKIKTVTEIVEMTGLERMRVLQEAGNLANNSIVKKTSVDGELAYEKDPFFTQHKKRILLLAGNKSKLAKLVTKSTPVHSTQTIKIIVSKQKLRDAPISIDDIDSFAKVRDVANIGHNIPIYEKDFKLGIQRILGEEGTFKDWGGEKNDLLSTRLILRGKRRRVAFGFKGRGQGGVLTPNRMGKNGDQIQRLFESAADVFLVQYWDRIGERVMEQMQGWAQLKSLKEQKEIFYGFIDGKDTRRLYAAYKDKFMSEGNASASINV